MFRAIQYFRLTKNNTAATLFMRKRTLVVTSGSRSSACQKKECGTLPKKHRNDPSKNAFWQDPQVWKRSTDNTLRCLVGCSIGDLSMLFYLQSYHPDISMNVMMLLPMFSGILTSLSLETIVLRVKEKLTWAQSTRTAWTMSVLSMIAMESSENVVSMYLTKGVIDPHSTFFWLSLMFSLTAGFIAAAPYNYYKLKKFGKACH